MPNVWETKYGLNPNSAADGLTDPDGDGVSTRNEYISGTVPTSTVSCLKYTAVALANVNDILCTMWLGSNRTSTLLSANSATSPKTPVKTVTTSSEGTNCWTDVNAVISTPRRFYVISVYYDGAGYTNTEEWAMHVQPRVNNNFYMVSVPVNLAPNNNLNSALGQQLGRGLYPGTTTNNSDRILFRSNNAWEEFFYMTNGVGGAGWFDYPGPTPVDYAVTPGMGFFLERRSGGPRSRTNCVFTGKSYASQATVSITTNNSAGGWTWTLFAWPFSTPRQQVNYGVGPTPSNQLGFEASAYGGKTFDATRPHADKGDQIWVWENGMFRKVYWLMGRINTNYNGRWWSDKDGTFGNITLEAGKAFFYRHHVATNGPATGTNFNWIMTAP